MLWSCLVCFFHLRPARLLQMSQWDRNFVAAHLETGCKMEKKKKKKASWLWSQCPELTRVLVIGEIASPCSQAQLSWRRGWGWDCALWKWDLTGVQLLVLSKHLQNAKQTKFLKFLSWQNGSGYFHNQQKDMNSEGVLKFLFQSRSTLELLSNAIVQFIYVVAGR